MGKIKASDLRIGNLVYSTTSNKIITIITLRKSSDVKATGIPLSEKWLLAFGFQEIEMQYILTNEFMDVKIMFYDSWILQFKSYSDGKIIESAELLGFWHVHQLQNLIHALTGEELNSLSQ